MVLIEREPEPAQPLERRGACDGDDDDGRSDDDDGDDALARPSEREQRPERLVRRHIRRGRARARPRPQGS